MAVTFMSDSSLFSYLTLVMFMNDTENSIVRCCIIRPNGNGMLGQRLEGFSADAFELNVM
jgi:hypothetical protein